MKVIVEVSLEEHDRIQLLVSQARYHNQEQFIQISLRNQLNLEQDAASGIATAPPTALPRNAPARSAKAGQIPQGLEPPSRSFKGDLLPEQLDATVSLPPFATKLWPLKLLVRFLANDMLRTGRSAFAASDVMTPLQNTAVSMRAYLQEMQRISPRQRGTFLHAGLPDGDSKSIKRFHDLYFTGRPQGNGPNQSLAVRLGLLNATMDKTDTVLVGLTPHGWKFAEMPNPVLDAEDVAAVESPFSDEEAKFIVSSIKDNSLPDSNLMKHMAKWLDLKPQSRDAALDYLRPMLVKQGANTPAMQSSSFVAVTSRLVELDCAVIVKDGLRTNYTAGARLDHLWGA